VVEGTCQRRFDDAVAERTGNRRERQLVLDAVGEDARARTVGLDQVRVFPAREWTRRLAVVKDPAALEVVVLGDPACLQRPPADLKDDTAAVLDAALLLDD